MAAERTQRTNEQWLADLSLPAGPLAEAALVDLRALVAAAVRSAVGGSRASEAMVEDLTQVAQVHVLRQLARFEGRSERGQAMFLFKAVGVEPVPNHTRDVQQGIASWDAYVHVPDPDALAAEFQARGVPFFRPLQDNSDNLRGFEIADVNGYVLYFGRPNPG